MSAAVFDAARAMVGAAFRLHGRVPETGLDCVGLVWAAHGLAGITLTAPRAYPLRGWRAERIVAALDASGLARCVLPARAGDVALIDAGAGQHHLAVLGRDSHVHAHAGLRRVVETPGWPDGVASVWRAI